MTARPSIRQLERRNDPNVVILPTTARRKVEQPCNAAGRAARAKLRSECPFPREAYQSPGERDAIGMAKAMDTVSRSPELYVLLMLLETMPREVRQAMIEALSLRAVVSETAMQAVHIIRSTMLTVGERMDLHRAQDRLREGVE